MGDNFGLGQATRLVKQGDFTREDGVIKEFRKRLGLTVCGKVGWMWKSVCLGCLPAQSEVGVTVNSVWSQIKAELELSVSKPLFEAYIKRLSLNKVRRDGDKQDEVVLSCQSAFQQSEIKKRWLVQIEEAWERLANKKARVKLVVDAQVGRGEKLNSPLFTRMNKTELLELEHNRELKRLGLKPELSLENFAVSGSNEMAYAAARAVAKNPGRAYNPLFLYGGVGVGKTHLMQGVGLEIVKKNRTVGLIYCSGEEFTNEIIDAIRKKSTSRFRKKYREVRVLLIDDIQFIAGKTAVQEEFFHTFNAVVGGGGQVIMTSDKPPKEIKFLEERLRSRFEGGLTIDIGEPDFELRSAILMIKARQLGVPLSSEAAQLIANQETNTRALLGRLMKVVAVSEAKKVKITTELVSEVLGEEEVRIKREVLTIPPKKIISEVAKHYDVGVNEVIGPKRVKQLVFVRHLAMYLLKKERGLGLVEIGSYFGGRDHTSVMHAVTKIEKLLSEDERLVSDLNEIKNKLVAT